MSTNPSSSPRPMVSLDARSERRLIRQRGSLRHVVFQLRVADVPRASGAERAALAISLVLDRSGSMHGVKIETARRAALAVLERLEERDQVAAVVFDNQIDVLQRAAPATGEVKARLRAELLAVQARGNTALHEGWLTGCNAIAPDGAAGASLARCFLLTDGLANVGLTDREQIASEAGGVRVHAGVGTSTFGIGDDYDETLLGPMAVAGGGQFHHLRSPDEIARTFVGELGELLAVAARQVRLEVRALPGSSAELISPYLMASVGGDPAGWVVQVGDLLGGEGRDVVLRFGFPDHLDGRQPVVSARPVWLDRDGMEHAGASQEITFQVADDAARRAEVQDALAMRVVGVQHAERAQREAIRLSRAGDIAGAQRLLRRVAERVAAYAGADPQLLEALQQLREAANELEMRGYAPAAAKEAYASSQMRSRGQRDLRGPR